MLRAIPNLKLRKKLKVLFCELYDLIRMHRRLDPNVSHYSVNGTLGEMNVYLPANVITALRAYMRMHIVFVAS